MLKIIDGKRYNTETATEVAPGGNGMSRSDFAWFSETLYRTKNGAWFRAGRGGPASKYRHACPDGGWNGGNGLVRLTSDEALAWLEENTQNDAIEEYFGDQIENA